MSINYREKLIEAIQNLLEAEQILFTSALNIAWYGELQHLSEAYDVNDVVPFDIELLKSVKDENVKRMISFSEPLIAAAEYIKNVNKITDEELR